MARGYIYRRAAVTREVLQALLDEFDVARGWNWTPATMRSLREAETVEPLAEGRVADGARELRWRQTDQGFELLLLALREQALDGFAPLAPGPGDGEWRTRAMPGYRLIRPSVAGDEEIVATAFVAPDGAIQFVALVGE